MGHPSPFDKPAMEYTTRPDAVAASIPSLTWPLIWLALTGYSVLSSATGIITDPGSGAFVLAVSLGLFYLALRFYRVRIEEREQWRDNKFWEWMDKPLPPPPATDWERFEYDAAKRVAKEEDPRRLGNINGKDSGVAQRRVKADKYKAPGTSSHDMHWDKRDLMRGDWWAR